MTTNPQTEQTSDPIYGYGITTDVTKTDKGYIYAEVYPSSQPWYRRLLPSVRNYWIEVTNVEDGVPYHCYEHDTGAYTLYGALSQAALAVQEIERGTQ